MATIASNAVSSWVGGSRLTDAPGGTLRSVNPANTGELVAEIQLGDAGTFIDACRAARAAQDSWAHTPAPMRGRAIQQIRRVVEYKREALPRVVSRKFAKPYSESLGEVQEI